MGISVNSGDKIFVVTKNVRFFDHTSSFFFFTIYGMGAILFNGVESFDRRPNLKSGEKRSSCFREEI